FFAKENEIRDYRSILDIPSEIFVLFLKSSNSPELSLLAGFKYYLKFLALPIKQYSR
ncbi:7394_t:CDS:2, partial [Racocetra persica]